MSNSLTVYQAYDRREIKTIPLDPASSVDGKFERAEAALKSPLSVTQRIRILKKTIELASSRIDELAMTVAREGGKPMMDAIVEINRGIQGIENAIETLRTRSGREIPMGITASSEGRLAFTTHEPIGIVVAVSAFNHPFNLIVHQVIPAVAVGCPVIIKPAMTTPLSCYNLVEMLHQAGLPLDYCQIALVENDGAELLVTDSRVAFFSFIGSAKVGWMLRSKLAPGARCALEHGGAAPVIIGDQVALDDIIPPIVKGGFYHSGQVCVSVQRVFVHQRILDEFCQHFTAAVKALIVGDPTLGNTEAGPLILPREVSRVASWVKDAERGGAKILTGGQILSETCYSPTVLLNPTDTAKVSTQEIFGPVVCIYGYKSVSKVIQQANSLPVAFQASVFSQNIDFALGTAKRLDAATVMINDHTAFRVDWMPFAGRRVSGHGTGGIPYTMEDMSQEKMIVLKSPALE